MFNKRKEYLKKEIKKINGIIEELPFRYEIVEEGKKMVREGIRQQYDKMKEVVDGAETRLKTERGARNPDQGIMKQMEDIIRTRSEDIKKMEEQMGELDKEIGEAQNTCQQKVEAARSYRMVVEKLLRN